MTKKKPAFSVDISALEGLVTRPPAELPRNSSITDLTVLKALEIVI